MMKERFANMFLDYVNDFLTVGGFASYYGMSDEVAERIINVGRKCHEQRAARNGGNNAN